MEGRLTMPRTILVHLNFEAPDDDGLTTDDLCAEIEAALQIAAEGEYAPCLAVCAGSIALAEEV
jgi:hypothetical protein